jgi:hypothetical protein
MQPTTITVTQLVTTTLPAVTLPQETTTVLVPSVVIMPTTTTVTITVPATTLTIPASASNTWLWSNNFWCLASIGSENSMNFLYTKHISTIGGGMAYVYTRLPVWWSNLLQSNVIILYNASTEPLSDLTGWPSQYISIFPFNVQQLQSVARPFALLEPNSNNSMSVIIVANSDSDIQSILNVMISQPVPVGVMWTITNGQIVTSN